MAIDLIWLGDASSSPPWHGGEVYCVQSRPGNVADFVGRYLQRTTAEAVLFWSSLLGLPELAQIEQLLESPADIWHAGLKLGTSGLPHIINFVMPTWMLNRDPEPFIEATSWRLTFDACLVRTEVLRQLGGPRPEFRTLLGAGLEFGHRCIMRGALVRHVPTLAPDVPERGRLTLPPEDEIEFLLQRFHGWQRYWALFRAAATRHLSPVAVFRGLYRARRTNVSPTKAIYIPRQCATAEPVSGRVTVLIPTLYRYSYLRTVLRQLRTQTVKPHEIIVVDQTAVADRDTSIAQEFQDLPLKIFYLGQAGQCTSRNLGLQHATGDYILFIDDDDEISDDLIESHLVRIQQFDVSSGIADEVGAGALPENFTFFRTSDVFPTNNTLIRKDILLKSGLFDLAYDHGQRADGDLGMRVYLSGALMVLDPQITVLHHHAPRGGLREHRARVITRASSRQSLVQRHLPTVSELYLGQRYFSTLQQREALLLRILGTFRVSGSRWKQLSKVLISSVLLPHTMFHIRKVRRLAKSMSKIFPQISELDLQTSADSYAVSHPDK